MKRILASLMVATVALIPLSFPAAASRGVRAASLQTPGGLSAADVQRLAQGATRHVIIILRDQHPELPARGALQAQRLATLAAEQAPLLAELAQLQAPRVRAFHLINAIAATVSAAEAARLSTNPAVQTVADDTSHRLSTPPLTPSQPASSALTAPALPPCAYKAQLAPEALGLIKAAYANPAIPQAQHIATGAGVTVAYLAEGLDIHNPDFIRPDGTPVFKDYVDFSGEGPNAPTTAAEAFLDAGSVAAQGNQTYNVNDYVNAAHRRPVACPQIKILGVAPGASLIGLKVVGLNTAFTISTLVEAVQYAVDHGADVISESLGLNLYDPSDAFMMANDAAVAAGVTVVTPTGDQGSTGTISSPGDDPHVITVGATTQFRIYKQIVKAGFQLGSGGFLDNNIASFSSTGPTLTGQKTVDVVAPGDQGWELCTPKPAIYLACTDLNGRPSPIRWVGGASEAAPLTAGEAALIIQAYRRSHGGASPSPALIKQIIMSTATDLGVPGAEQGAGLINCLRAVRAALSYHDANGNPTPVGAALLTAPTAFTSTANPNTPESYTIAVTNTGAVAQTVTPTVRTLGPVTWSAAYTPALNPSTDPSFVDENGSPDPYTEQDFTVPAGQDRLDAAISWDVVRRPGAVVAVTLFDPHGRFAAYSFPAPAAPPPVPASGYGHAEVRQPAAGTWRAIVWTNPPSSGTAYTGTVHLSLSTANAEPAGEVSPTVRVLLPGHAGTFMVQVRTPAQPGDQSDEVQMTASAGGIPTTAGAVPIALRSLVPLGPTGGTFGGTLTGGNGNFNGPELAYQFDVPSGLKDLALNMAIADSHYNLEGLLVDPAGLPLDVQSTVTALNPATGLPRTYTNTMQFFRRDPQPGRWLFVLVMNDNISGAYTSLPFTATIALDSVRVSAPGLPDAPRITLPSGVPTTVQVTITNTGNTGKDFFVDPRLVQAGALWLGSGSFALPQSVTAPVPTFIVPPETSELLVAAESMTPTVPISLETADGAGTPPYGQVFAPDLVGTSSIDPLTGNNDATVAFSAPEVPFGDWFSVVAEAGTFGAGGAPASTAQLGAVATTQQLDAAISSSTGDEWAVLTGQTGSTYTPLTLAPGQTGTISVTITPSAARGTVVSGHLYVDTFALDARTGTPITFSGDELIALPYAYTVG